MAQAALQDGAYLPTLSTSVVPSHQPTDKAPAVEVHAAGRIEWITRQDSRGHGMPWAGVHHQKGDTSYKTQGLGSTGKGILIGMLSAFGSAAFIALLVAIVYFFRYTQRGRVFLDSIGRPGEYDDEQQFLREEEEALGEMDDMQRSEYNRAKGEQHDFVKALYVQAAD